MLFPAALVGYLRRQFATLGADANIAPRIFGEEWPDHIIQTLAQTGQPGAIRVQSLGGPMRDGPMTLEIRRFNFHIVAADFVEGHRIERLLQVALEGFRDNPIPDDYTGPYLKSAIRETAPLSFRHQDRRWPTIVVSWIVCFGDDPPYTIG